MFCPFIDDLVYAYADAKLTKQPVVITQSVDGSIGHYIDLSIFVYF